MGNDMEAFAKFKKRDGSFWLCLGLTVALCYGFTLSHYSVGVDDERFAAYFYTPELLEQGRWLPLLFSKIFTWYEFLPFWRDATALLVMTAALCLWRRVFAENSRGAFRGAPAAIFACVAVSFPYIAQLFVFMTASVEIGLSLLFSAAAVRLYGARIRGASHRPAWLDWGLCVLLLLLGDVWRTFTYALCGLCATCILLLLNDPRVGQYRFSRCAKLFFAAVATVLAAVLLDKLISETLMRALNVTPTGYTNRYILYDLNDLSGSIGRYLRGLAAKYDHFSFPEGTIGLCFLAMLLSLIYFAVARRRPLLIVLGLALTLSAFAMGLVTGDATPLDRIMFTLCLPTGFCCALVAMAVRRIPWRYAGPLYCALMVVLVFNQTKWQNEVYYTDYVRYQRDLHTMESLADDIRRAGGAEDAQVVFVGNPPAYNLDIGEVAGESIFRWDRLWNLDKEILSRRIYDFFAMHGYSFKRIEGIVANQALRDEAFRAMFDMPVWPEAGGIRDMGEYYLVRLGYLSNAYAAYGYAPVADYSRDGWEKGVLRAENAVLIRYSEENWRLFAEAEAIVSGGAEKRVKKCKKVAKKWIGIYLKDGSGLEKFAYPAVIKPCVQEPSDDIAAK